MHFLVIIKPTGMNSISAGTDDNAGCQSRVQTFNKLGLPEYYFKWNDLKVLPGQKSHIRASYPLADGLKTI